MIDIIKIKGVFLCMLCWFFDFKIEWRKIYEIFIYLILYCYLFWINLLVKVGFKIVENFILIFLKFGCLKVLVENKGCEGLFIRRVYEK